MMFSPVRTAFSARLHKSSIHPFIPSGPNFLSKVTSITLDKNWLSPISLISLIFCKSEFFKIGCLTSNLFVVERFLRSKRLGLGPMSETKLITDSSRIGSIGGLVT